ncbi:hypothetical protein [Dactylosporangium darangshiense]|uniref:Uncharacterized protein n=1 Tax=Dactylosporangium darangshiense TaxID=579108 RepID=A0ABP8DRZ0_9ACTN
MTDPATRPDIPTRANRETRNAALRATSAETGFWDDNGRPAPWPDDIDEWQPFTANPQRHTPKHDQETGPIP